MSRATGSALAASSTYATPAATRAPQAAIGAADGTSAPGPRDLRLLRSLARRIDPTDAGAHNNLGVLFYNAGSPDEAAVAFMRALELDPRMEVAQRNFEVACVNSGQAGERMAALREHLRAHPADRERRWVLVRISSLLGDHPEAIAQLGVLLADQPDDVRALIELGLCHTAVGAMDEAYAAFRRAVKADPDSSLPYFHLAELEYHHGLNEQAVELLRSAIARNRENHEAWYLLAFVLGDMGHLDEARAASQRALELNPDLAHGQANLSVSDTPRATYVDKARRDAARDAEPAATPNSPLTHVSLGLAFRNRGYHAEALAEYQQALDRGEDIDVVQQAMAELYLLQRDANRAQAVYEALLQRHPRDAKLWNEHGIALHQGGRDADALRSYENALAIDPAYALALNNSGVARYHAGDGAGALDLFTRAIAASPLTEARLNLALLHYRAKRPEQALEMYRCVAAGDPTNAVAWNGIGLVLADVGQLAEARTAYARAIEARPRYAEAHHNLSFVLSKLGDIDGAIRENKLALEIDAYYGQQEFELAVDFELGRPDVAIEPVVSTSRTDENVPGFAPESGVLDAVFGDLVPAPASPPERAGSDPYAMAEEFLSKGFFDRARAETVRVMRRDGDAARGNTVLGDVFARQQLWGEALERYRDARRDAPESVAAMMGEATALLRLGHGADARELAEAIVGRLPDDVEALLLAAGVRDATGDARGAYSALVRARHVAPVRADVHVRYGELAERMGDTTGAVSAYREALARDPACLSAHVALARVYMATHAWPDAEREFAAAIEIDRSHVEATIALSVLRRILGRARDALNLLVAFIERDLYCFPALMELGETLLALGQPADAAVVFSRVLRFDPGHPGARRALGELQVARVPSAAAGAGG